LGVGLEDRQDNWRRRFQVIHTGTLSIVVGGSCFKSSTWRSWGFILLESFSKDVSFWYKGEVFGFSRALSRISFCIQLNLRCLCS
jgi:hypothetical protein